MLTQLASLFIGPHQMLISCKLYSTVYRIETQHIPVWIFPQPSSPWLLHDFIVRLRFAVIFMSVE